MVKTWGDVIKEFEVDILPKMREDFVIDYRPCCEPYSDVFVPNGLLVYLQDGSQLIYLFEPGKDLKMEHMISSCTPEMFALEMKKIASMGKQGHDDNGIRFSRMEVHAMADGLLCYALEKLGYKEGVEIFKSIPKWYA